MPNEEENNCVKEQYEIEHGNNGTSDPVILKLSCGLTSSQLVTVVAKPKDHFVINLRDNAQNILLHFVIKGNTLVLNSFFEKWGKEDLFTPAPFKIDEKFCVTLHYEKEGYRIFIKGEEFTFYKHRAHTLPKICEVRNGQIYKVIYGKDCSNFGLWLITTGCQNNGPKFLPTDFPISTEDITRDLIESIKACQQKLVKPALSSKICGSPQFYVLNNYSHNGIQDTKNIDLKYGFTSNMVISAVGKTTRRFTIMFKDTQDNILLSCGARVDQNVVVLNSYFGSWGTEERPSIMPIYSDKKCCVTIAYETAGYRIFVNGSEFSFYKHRSQNSITLCQIAEGTLYKFSYGKNQPTWAIQEPPKREYAYDYNVEGIATPHISTFHEKLNVGACLLVTGIINTNAKEFTINLIDEDDSVLLQFNPRFNENCIIRKTYLQDSDDKEERDGGLPLEKGARFTIAFVIETLCFRIYINGDEFVTYPHQELFHTLAKIKIEDDVKIYKITQQV